jgi:hypothetical protein
MAVTRDASGKVVGLLRPLFDMAAVPYVQDPGKSTPPTSSSRLSNNDDRSNGNSPATVLKSDGETSR